MLNSILFYLLLLKQTQPQVLIDVTKLKYQIKLKICLFLFNHNSCQVYIIDLEIG